MTQLLATLLPNGWTQQCHALRHAEDCPTDLQAGTPVALSANGLQCYPPCLGVAVPGATPAASARTSFDEMVDAYVGTAQSASVAAPELSDSELDKLRAAAADAFCGVQK